jgi:hypothetical protein
VLQAASLERKESALELATAQPFSVEAGVSEGAAAGGGRKAAERSIGEAVGEEGVGEGGMGGVDVATRKAEGREGRWLLSDDG